MKDYFSHDYNSRNDKKLVLAFMKFGLEAIGAYWCIVEMLYEEGGYLPLSEYDRITFELRSNDNCINYLIYDSDLFKNDGVRFWSETAIERLKIRADKSEKARKSIESRWSRKQDTNVLPSNEERNTNKGKERKVNESKLENKKEILDAVVDNFHSICTRLSKIKGLTNNRIKSVNARLAEFSFDEIINAFTLVNASDFLCGVAKVERPFKADFDWIFNQQNMTKILEGRYNNKTNTSPIFGKPENEMTDLEKYVAECRVFMYDESIALEKRQEMNYKMKLKYGIK